MKKIVKLTESDMIKLVKKVVSEHRGLNEGIEVHEPFSSFPDGVYLMQKVQGPNSKGEHFVKQGKSVKVYSGKELKDNEWYGGGTIYNGTVTDSN